MYTEKEQALKCLDDRNDGTCEGEVELRYPLSPTGKWYPRCEKHWYKRCEQQDQINKRYGHADSNAAPPSDFDPAYAGERWDEDY